jgi:uncharacterized coiled-coil DUF342 family protein
MFRRAKDDDGSSSTSKSSKAPRLAGSKEAEEFDQEFTKIEKATNVYVYSFINPMINPNYFSNALKSPLKNILYRLNKMDDRFDEIDGRFDEIDDRFDSVDNRFDSLDNRLDKVFGVHKEKDATNVQWEEMCYHQLQQKFRERSFERNEYLTIGSGAYKMVSKGFATYLILK